MTTTANVEKSRTGRKAGTSSKIDRFVAEYAVDLNATAAAERSGYRWPEKMGWRLLQMPKVREALAANTEQLFDELDFSVDRTLQQVARVAFFDPIHLFEDDGSLKRMCDIDPDTRAVIAGLEVVELFEGDGEQRHAYGLLKKVKLADRLRALDMLMRYHSLYKDKVEHTGKDGGPVEFVVKSILERD